MDGISEKLLVLMALAALWALFQDKALAQPKPVRVGVHTQLLQANPNIGVLPSYR